MQAAAGQEVQLAPRVQKRRQVPLVRVAVQVLVLEVLDYAVLAVLAAAQEVGIRGLHAVRAVVVILHDPQEQDRCPQQQGRRARSIGTSGTCGPARALSSSPLHALHLGSSSVCHSSQCGHWRGPSVVGSMIGPSRSSPSSCESQPSAP